MDYTTIDRVGNQLLALVQHVEYKAQEAGLVITGWKLKVPFHVWAFLLEYYLAWYICNRVGTKAVIGNSELEEKKQEYSARMRDKLQLPVGIKWYDVEVGRSIEDGIRIEA